MVLQNIVEKFSSHPSILKIKENVKIEKPFHFEIVDEHCITYRNIPPRIINDNKDIFSPFITKMYNQSNSNCYFPNSLKLADVPPVYKKEKRTMKDN